MHSPVGIERWAAIRALREGESPTFPRLAAACDLNPATIRERALRDDWRKMRFPRGGAKAGPAEAQASTAAEEGGPDAVGLAEDLAEAGQAVSLEDLRRRYADVLPRQLKRILAQAERGVLDKARIDALISIGRVFERSVALAEEQAVKEQRRSDDELAAILERIDDRIVELAEAHAERLVAEKLRDALG